MYYLITISIHSHRVILFHNKIFNETGYALLYTWFVYTSNLLSDASAVCYNILCYIPGLLSDASAVCLAAGKVGKASASFYFAFSQFD